MHEHNRSLDKGAGGNLNGVRKWSQSWEGFLIEAQS